VARCLAHAGAPSPPATPRVSPNPRSATSQSRPAQTPDARAPSRHQASGLGDVVTSRKRPSSAARAASPSVGGTVDARRFWLTPPVAYAIAASRTITPHALTALRSGRSHPPFARREVPRVDHGLRHRVLALARVHAVRMSDDGLLRTYGVQGDARSAQYLGSLERWSQAHRLPNSP